MRETNIVRFDNFFRLWEYAKTELHSQLKVDLPNDALRVSTCPLHDRERRRD